MLDTSIPPPTLIYGRPLSTYRFRFGTPLENLFSANRPKLTILVCLLFHYGRFALNEQVSQLHYEFVPRLHGSING